MTVEHWIRARTPAPPVALQNHIVGCLGADAAADAGRTSDVCLAAAARSLEAMLVSGQFGRGSALDLLAIDALATYAYERASEAECMDDLDELAARGLQMLGQHVTTA
jgi:hypothetical protein